MNEGDKTLVAFMAAVRFLRKRLRLEPLSKDEQRRVWTRLRWYQQRISQ